MTLPLRADLASIPLYAPKSLEGVDLDLRDNINLWGIPPAALAAIQQTGIETARNYPAVSAGALAAALADELGIAASQIVAGCGSDDILDACVRAVAGPGTLVAHADPTFAMLPTFARLNGRAPVAVPLTRGGAMDVGALLATKAPLIYACSPNNPTGTVTPTAELIRLFDRAPGVVLLDEAYCDFSDAHDLRREAAGRENVLVTRTFSKAWGLAGLRVGYGVGGQELVAAVTKARGPYKVNAIAERAAVEALRQDRAWVARVARETRDARDRLAAALTGRVGVRLWKSEGNFVFLEVAERSADLVEAFRQRGIGVRGFSGLRDIGEALRIGVAPWDQLQRVVQAAEEIWP